MGSGEEMRAVSKPGPLPSPPLVQQPEFPKTLPAQTEPSLAENAPKCAEGQRGGTCPKSIFPIILTTSLVSAECAFPGWKLSSRSLSRCVLCSLLLHPDRLCPRPGGPL